MKSILLLSLSLIVLFNTNAQQTAINIIEVANMPEPVSNNAVIEGWANDTGYVYSFSGIDTTKLWSGIHLKSFRYNTISDTWDTIPNLPGTTGKIAAGASYVDSIIYIIGGYHVLADGSEISSDKVHRFDPKTNTYLTDGTNIPVAIDDHVQAVYNDSLIYVITGWSNTANVPNVQIYDPTNNNWLTGTSVFNNNTFKAFGASGTIIGNTIYYHGGASMGTNFPAKNMLRIGQIDSNDPTQITWTATLTSYKTYRSASTEAFGYPHWLGGSEISYNYDGIAYNGTGGVPNKTSNLSWVNNVLDTIVTTGNNLPMDLRGIASINNFTKYVTGGMINGQQVSDKTFKIEFNTTTSISEKSKQAPFKICPNPVFEKVNLMFNTEEVRTVVLLDVIGNVVFTKTSNTLNLQLDISGYSKGVYFVKVITKEGSNSQKIIIQ